MLRACSFAGLIAIAGAAPALAQRPPVSFEIVVETPTSIESTLRRLTRDGHTCAAVARPAGRELSTNIAVVFSRRTPPSAAPPARAAADMKVLIATAGTVDDLERGLNAAAAQGYAPCGITMAAPLWGRPSLYSLAAVLARTRDEPTGVAYRVVRSRSRREDWAQLDRAGADGFVVSRLVSRPDQPPANTSDIVFIAEKTATSKPTRYELAFGGNGPAPKRRSPRRRQRPLRAGGLGDGGADERAAGAAHRRRLRDAPRLRDRGVEPLHRQRRRRRAAGAVPREGRDDGAARRRQPVDVGTAPSRACSPTAPSASTGRRASTGS